LLGAELARGAHEVGDEVPDVAEVRALRALRDPAQAEILFHAFANLTHVTPPVDGRSGVERHIQGVGPRVVRCE